MAEMESRLRSALRRRPAPAGFAARVLSRVERESGARATPPRSLPKAGVLAVAAALALVAAGAGVIEHERRIERRNRAALEQTVAALALAATHLGRAQAMAFSSTGWERAAERLARLSAPAAQPPPATTHSSPRGSRI